MARTAGVVLAILASAMVACGGDDDGAARDDAGAVDAAVPCETDDDCDDANPCTADACGGDGVCEHQAAREDESCNDGLACTAMDHCEGGACVGEPTDCSFLDDFCVAAACVEAEGGCVITERPDGTSCDDGSFCTVDDECQDGVCGGAARDCDGVADGCNTASCDDGASACVPVARGDGADCEDGVTCTAGDACDDGSCVGGPPPACDDSDACTANVCDADGDACDNPPIPPIANAEGPPGDPTCSDGVDNDCDNLSDLDDPECGDCTVDGDCDDLDDCTFDDCDTGVCDNAPLTNTACDDGDYCTDGDECDAGLCTSGPARTCSDGVACTLDQCDEDANACVNPARAVDPASPVGTSAGASVCLVAGSGARAIAWAELRDTDGDPITGAAVTIGGDPAAESTAQPGTYWIQLDAAGAPASQNLPVIATACGDAVQLATTVPVEHAAPNDGDGGTGGCSPTGGNLRIRVIAAETGLPVAGARILVGQAQGTPFQHAIQSLFGGAPFATTNVGTSAANGTVEFYDLGTALDGAVTVTAGATDRAYVTVVAASASDVVLPLPLLHPPAVPTTTYDAGTSMASVGNCNDLDVGLVLPRLDLAFFTDLDLDRFFGKTRCWDSMNGNVGVVAVSDNFWIAEQAIGLFCLGGTVEEGTWSAPLPNTAATGETEDVTLLHVRIPLADIEAVTSGGAPFRSLLSATSYRGLGFMLDESVPTPPTNGRSIPVTDNYPNAFTVTYSSKPTDTDIIGFVLGDHAGSNGVGPLAVIGHKVHPWDVAGSTVAIPNSDLDQPGGPSGMRRMASISALYLDAAEHTANPIPTHRVAAVSTVLLRGGDSAPFGASGGAGSVTDFLGLAGTTAVTPGELRWENTTNNGNAPMYSRHDLVVETSEYLPVLSCDNNNSVHQEDSVQWVVYRPFGVSCGADECYALPTLPASFPRATTATDKRSGFEALVGPGTACGACPAGSACVDPDGGGGPATSMCMSGAGTDGDPYATQAYRWRVHVYDLGLQPGFDFDDFTFADHEALVTHESANSADLP